MRQINNARFSAGVFLLERSLFLNNDLLRADQFSILIHDLRNMKSVTYACEVDSRGDIADYLPHDEFSIQIIQFCVTAGNLFIVINHQVVAGRVGIELNTLIGLNIRYARSRFDDELIDAFCTSGRLIGEFENAARVGRCCRYAAGRFYPKKCKAMVNVKLGS